MAFIPLLEDLILTFPILREIMYPMKIRNKSLKDLINILNNSPNLIEVKY